MLKIIPKLFLLQHGYPCTSCGQVILLFLLSNPSDITESFLHWIAAVHVVKIGNGISIIILGKQIRIN